MPIQLGGPIGPFLDRVQQRQVPATVVATCEYTSSVPAGDPTQIEQHIQAQMLRAIREVIGRKMETRELTFRHLSSGDVAAVVPEIIAVSGLQQSGIHVGNLSMAFGIDGHAPMVAPAGPAPAAPRHDVSAGTFDVGGGQQLRVKIDGMTPETFVKNKAAQQLWGWAIGAAIIGLMGLTVVGVALYVLYVVSLGAPSAGKAAAASWDGKTTFECGGNDVVSLSGVTATAGVRATGNCTLTMTEVNITAPVAIEAAANAKVTMKGGSITASSNSVVASAHAKVELVGTKVSGQAKTSGAAKVTGAP